MAHIYKDNVREGSTSTGTGVITTNGGIGPVSTAVIGQTFGSVCSVGDMFEYVVHNRSINEWEVGRGRYTGTNQIARDYVIASSNSGALVNFSAGDKAVWIAPTSVINNFFMNLVNIQQWNAFEGSDNTAAVAAARTFAGTTQAIISPGNTGTPWGVKSVTDLDFAADGSGEGALFSASFGTASAPATTSSPVIYIEKTTQTSPTDINDHGGIDVRVDKVGGTNNVYGQFVAVRDGAGTGIVTSLYSIVKVDNPNSTYAAAQRIFLDKTVTASAGTLYGTDMFLIDSSGQDNGWTETGVPAGSTVGFSLNANPGRGTYGWYLNSSTSGNGFYTGMMFDTNSVMPTSFDGKSEAIRIKGGQDSAHAYSGIWLEAGSFITGINLVGPTYSNSTMMVLPKDNHIAFGTDTTATTYVNWESTVDLFNIQGNGLAVNGAQVVGSRSTGWSAPTGTASKATFATSSVSTANLAQFVFAMYNAMVSHGLIGA